MKKAKKNTDERITFRTFAEPLLYLLPFLIIISCFMIFPVIQVFLSSIMEGYDYIAGTYESVGLENFRLLFQDEDFIKALKNTFTYVILVVPAATCLAMLIAVQLNKKIRLRGLFQFAYFLPLVTATIAIGLSWKWMFNTEYGIINYFLSFFGLKPIDWLNSPEYSMWALVIYGIWSKLPMSIILLLSGLQTIDEQYYRVARLDGAKPLKMFFRITLPLLSPTVILVTILNVINTSKVFNEVYALFDGSPGPARSLYTVVFFIYENFYKKWEVSLACAGALVLFAIVFILTAFQMQLQKRWVKL